MKRGGGEEPSAACSLYLQMNRGEKKIPATTKIYCTFFFKMATKPFFAVLRVVKLFEDVTCTHVHTCKLKMKRRFE